MSDPVLSVAIDRIRLTGLEVTPEGAERLRGRVEVELQRLLERERWPEGLFDGEVSRLDAPTMHVDTSHGDYHVANRVARSIAQSLGGVGNQEK
jgi:hypothetical protein